MTGQREKNPGARRAEADQPVEEEAEVRQPVKEGETQPGPSTLPDGPQFELTGGEVCLDFANTVDSRPTPEPVELLNSYGDLLSWSLQKEVITPDLAEMLWEDASAHPRKADATLAQAVALREALFGVFSASARGTSPPLGALELLNRLLPPALGHLRLALNDSRYRLTWEEDAAMDRMLWPILRSAADLLTSDRLARVRICSAEDCDWLFLDQSKNRSRRWCDMGVCGNRNKVRRFRQARASGSNE
jgi:predicted RNA-binding Zn ribbon-like protein